MVKKVAFLNYKDKLSKTVTILNSGWMLASKGYKVVLVDADSQCNLTEKVLEKATEKKYSQN